MSNSISGSFFYRIPGRCYEEPAEGISDGIK